MPTMRPLPLLTDANPPTVCGPRAPACLTLALLMGFSAPTWAADPGSQPLPAASAAASAPAPPKKSYITGLPTKAMAEQVRDAVETSNSPQKRLTLVVNGKAVSVAPGGPQSVTPPGIPTAAPATAPKAVRAVAPPKPPRRANPPERPTTSQPASSGKADPALSERKWSHHGETGPQAWGQLKPEFKLCASGQRQSPINIDEPSTLQGPAEPLQFNYQPSTGSVVHNGHTIQVDVEGDNAVTVRDSTFRLVHFHFHTPSEIRINDRSAAMVVYLVHKNDKGQLAVVAVMLDPGAANTLINTVWTYMPLDTGDRVRLPVGAIDLNELLPKDQRYYQFMGSLTTPPCTEGVLWLVLKQVTPISPEQLKLFTQLFPSNARPVQALNGRPVRNAQ